MVARAASVSGERVASMSPRDSGDRMDMFLRLEKEA
jgi:hypothetical protein